MTPFCLFANEWTRCQCNTRIFWTSCWATKWSDPCQFVIAILSLKSFGNFAVYLLTARVQQNEEGRQVPRHSCFEGLTHNPIGRSSLLEVMMVQRTPGWLYSHLLEFVCTPPPSPPPLIWGCWGYTTKSTKNNILAFHAAVKMWRVTWFQHISTLSTFHCWILLERCIFWCQACGAISSRGR